MLSSSLREFFQRNRMMVLSLLPILLTVTEVMAMGPPPISTYMRQCLSQPVSYMGFNSNILRDPQQTDMLPAQVPTGKSERDDRT